MGFLALIPVKDWIYAAIIGSVLIGGYVFIHKCHSAENELRDIATQSKALLKAANEKIKTDATDHATAIAANKVVYETELKDNAAQHTADLERLRVLNAYRQSHPDMARTPAGPSGGESGNSGKSQSDLSFAGLGDVAAGLADGLRDAVTALDTCTRERDSLIGQP